jgi:hypothetical protein
LSPLVHAFESEQDCALGVFTHPTAGSQLSVVHTLPSLQLTGSPAWHDPPEQTSALVHAEPSLHGTVLFENTHPVPGLHESLVQTLPSLQTSELPETQEPSAHLSPEVQALPSEQDAALFE